MLDRNPALDPEDWPLPDKLRLLAFVMDCEDIGRKVFEHHNVQDDLREAADILEGKVLYIPTS